MEQIIKTCFDYLDNDYLKDQFRWQTGMKEELERLRDNCPKIQAVLDFASSQQKIGGHNNTALNECICQLKVAIAEAVDVLDKLEYMKREQQLANNTEETKKRKLVSFLFESARKILKIGERGLKIDPSLQQLEEVVQKLDKLSAYVTPFHHLLKSANKEQKKQEVDFYKARETASLPTTNDLIGRGEAKEFVIQWLRKLSNEHGDKNISLLSIVGHGGMGKTTLLQHVCNDEITKEFDRKMWVCVSNNFDVNKVIADMLSTLKEERPRLDDQLETLQNSLRTEIRSKKFLLILDDIWEEEENQDISKWENVLAPLAYGKIGSGILVTTRLNSVAMMIAKVIKKKTEIFRLEGLKEDQCLQLLNSHAFADVENTPDDYKRLRSIAGEIVKKLSGSPLAAKVIGRVLNDNLDESHWSTVLKSNLLVENSINSILRLSYIVLPNHLQNCFAICCMFPQDHAYDKDDLVRMWIALGFIQPYQGMTMEDIGGRYFNVLVKKALFDKVEDDYKMHDLIHESASNFFAQKSDKLVDDEQAYANISETIQHLSVQTTNPNIIKKIEQFKCLHSVFFFYEDSHKQDFCHALIEIFKASRSLRLLYIFAPSVDMISEEIGNLIHLRYLKIELEKLTMLPRSLSKLYFLQYIIHKWSMSKRNSEVDDFLPSDINNLSDLRYVELPCNYISSIREIGKLKFLQELDTFTPRDVSGYRIGELENMNDLCKLGINCLENVKDAEEACSAKLCEKRRLTDLTLNWSNTYSRNIDLDENVLDNLQPPKDLRNLSIWNYRGGRSAIWMNNVNLISNLQEIALSDCMKWETLPPFWQLPFLKSLILHYMPKVKWLVSKFNRNDKYDAFPLLEFLKIEHLEALEDWFEPGVATDDGCLFPCLIKLKLNDCPKLKELPSLPPKLKTLQIEKTGWTTLNFCSNSHPLPLESLYVVECPNITSVPLDDEIARLAALRRLSIRNCPNITSLDLVDDMAWISDPSVLLMEPLRSICFLKMLTIKDNDELISFPNEAEQWFLNDWSSLSRMEFRRLKSLESLPSSLESLSSLQTLSIRRVPMLRELPNLPPSLKRLSIWGCHPELKERYGEDGGSDRHKIAHIPHIRIYTTIVMNI